LFDKIREQRHITTEFDGSTHLLRLLGKAYDLNVKFEKKKKNSKSKLPLLHDGSVDIENSNLALRMGAQTATTHFDLDTYEMDDEEENQMDMFMRETQEIEPMPNSPEEEEEEDDDGDNDGEEDEDDDEDNLNQEEKFWDTLDDTDDEEEEENIPNSAVSFEGSADQPKPPKIDVLSLWRMRVPRHRKLLKDCVIHLGERTERQIFFPFLS
jgi:hypothetical protein